jgi:hypothetical protein
MGQRQKGLGRRRAWLPGFVGDQVGGDIETGLDRQHQVEGDQVQGIPIVRQGLGVGWTVAANPRTEVCKLFQLGRNAVGINHLPLGPAGRESRVGSHDRSLASGCMAAETHRELPPPLRG